MSDFLPTEMGDDGMLRGFVPGVVPESTDPLREQVSAAFAEYGLRVSAGRSATFTAALAPLFAARERAAAEKANKTIMAAGDARVAKARAEQDRGRAEADKQKREMAHDHAWALRNQADGLWEAAAIVRAQLEGDGA